MREMPARLDELDLQTPIAVLCHGGMRSASIAAWLAANGAVTVANIAGGIDAWSVSVDPTISRY